MIIESREYPVQRGRPKRAILVGARGRATAPARFPQKWEGQVTHLPLLVDGGGRNGRVSGCGTAVPLVSQELDNAGPAKRNGLM